MEMKKELAGQLKNLGAAAVYVFGSTAEALTQPESDIDLAILMHPESDSKDFVQLYTNLYDILTQVFPGKKLDIVPLQRSPLELRFDVISHGRAIFESDSNLRLDFEEQTARQYADFKPVLKNFNQAILNRI